MRYQKIVPEAEEDALQKSTSEQILAAARTVFFEKGYKNAKIREISTKAEVNLGLIPYYFTSKENLASVVYFRLLDELYSRIETLDLYTYSYGERLYICNYLVWEMIDKDASYALFYYELLGATTIADAPSQPFRHLSEKIIEEYGLKVTETQNRIYMAAAKGSEKMLTTKRAAGELPIHMGDVCNIILSNYFYNLGLSDQEIAKIIHNSERYLRTHGHLN